MNPKEQQPSISHGSDLRRRAEELLRVTPTDIADMSGEDVERLVHELQVHQIELELQNEELREAQVELAESRDRYSDLYEFAPVGYLSLDRDGKIREANLTAAAMLEIERKALSGTNISIYIARESQDDFYQHRRAVFSSGAKQVCEIGMRTGGGKLMAVRLESIASGLQGDRCCRTAFIDITGRKRAEARQRESEERFRNVFEHAATGIAITDWEGRFRHCNPAFCALLGYTEEECRQIEAASLIHPADREAELAGTHRLKVGETDSYETEIRAVHKDGRPVWMHKFVSTLPDATGKAAHLMALVTDVTARRLAAEQLRGREERLTAIMNATADAIITIDAEGVIVVANPSAEYIFGYDPEELPGRDVRTLIPSFVSGRQVAPGEHRQQIEESMQIPIRSEVKGVRKDGSAFDAALSVREVQSLGLFTAVVRDITRRKQLEHEVICAAEEECQRIAHDLHDDLGSLLTGIKLATEALTGDIARAGSGEAEKCRIIARQIGEAITKTRTIARGLSPVGPDPEDLIGALEGLSRQTKEATDLQCRCECPDPVRIGDPVVATHLFRIAQEAVNNAVKYSGGTAITISLRERDNALELRIEDDGAGFVPTQAHGGGLGLHIMDYRAHALNASLRIGQRPGGGTCVVCTVPLVASAG